MGDIGAEEKICTFDQLIRQRAVDIDQTPLFAYPKSQLGVSDYEFITGKDLNRLVDGAAKAFVEAGIQPVYEDTVVGVYSPSDLDYLINIYALGRLGYTCFLISPRLPPSAVASLLANTDAHIFIHSSGNHSVALEVAHYLTYSMTAREVLPRSSYDHPADTVPLVSRDVDPIKEQHRRYIMLHSSGSTGLPKPIDYTNARLLVTCLTSPSLIAFQSLPFSHAHGLVTYSQAIWTRKTIYLFNSNVPHTNRTLTEAIVVAKPEIVWTVPYVLKLLAESEEGIQALKACKVVSSSGSRCPDSLGDMLTERGVFLGCLFGSTEASLLFTSLTRPRDDTAWNYLCPPPHVLPYLLMKPVSPGNEICECVVLDGHRAKSISNSDDPPNSFYTSDLFIAHPSIPNAWKFIGRADDRVTLLNGEKVLPLPMEGRIVQNPLVREAVVFGVDRPLPGLLLFRAKTDEARNFDDEKFLDRVWPSIQDANARAEAFAQIGKEMVVVLGEDVDFPATDKSTIKRAQVYREFASVINDVYARLESNLDEEGTLQLDVQALKSWIISKFEELGFGLDENSDFFASGVDSLKAIQMRGLIIQNLDLGGNGATLPSMIVYDCGNVETLARKLYEIRCGEASNEEDEVKLMEDMIERHSALPKIVVGTGRAPEKAVVILTGATGFLGSHILCQLISSLYVSKIYCLIRTNRTQTASTRLTESLKYHSLPQIISSPKLIPLSATLTEPNFGLQPDILTTLRSETTHIIHSAWAVNFALPLSSFSPQLSSLQNLLSLSLAVSAPKPAQVIFCSSISAALSTASPLLVPSRPLDDLSQASTTGYGRSKLVAEKVIERVVEESGVRATVLRIGQIVPSRKVGSKLWNSNEMIPLVVRSARAVGALPDRLGSGDSCEWVEVDVVAAAVADACGLGAHNENSSDKKLVYNIVHPRSFSWKDDFLPKLKGAGLAFETIEYGEWLERLRNSVKDAEKNPSRKLLEFWEAQIRSREGRVGNLKFDIDPAEDMCEALKTAEMVTDGNLVKELLDAWNAAW